METINFQVQTVSFREVFFPGFKHLSPTRQCGALFQAVALRWAYRRWTKQSGIPMDERRTVGDGTVEPQGWEFPQMVVINSKLGECPPEKVPKFIQF